MRDSISITGLVARREAIAAPIYFLAYLAYLFARPESELLHWLSLVLVPLALVVVLRPGHLRSPSSILASVGLKRGNLRSGLLIAFVAGLALSGLQLVLSRYRDDFVPILTSGRIFYLLPVTFVLMLVTAGSTEEFFFRGFLQTRLERLFGSRIIAVIGASILFGVYHLPYAYLNPRWPSAGDWSAAWTASMGQAVPAGILLGFLYSYSRRNLLACAVMHAMLNTLPGMTMIKFGGG